MQQVASDLNKSKRQSNINVVMMAGITEIVWQVMSYSKIFSRGYHHLIPGRITIMPANHATAGLECGSFRATNSQNGKRLGLVVPFYGFTGNVR